MQLQSYLFFDGRCEEAIEFYRKTLGAEVLTMMRFKDNPQPAMNPPGSGEKVFYGEFLVNAQGEDVVAGIRTPQPISELEAWNAYVYNQLRDITAMLEKLGFKVKIPENLFRKKGFLGGSDDERAAELMAAFADPEVKAILPGTGGYGTTRIVDKLDY